MTTKERVIKRLNKGFGFNITFDAHWRTHERSFRDCGGMSWYFSDLRLGHLQNCGQAEPASEHEMENAIKEIFWNEEIQQYVGDYIELFALLGAMKGIEQNGAYECRAVYWFDN